MGLRSQSLPQAQAEDGVGSCGLHLRRREGGWGLKVEAVELDLEWLQGDWEQQWVGCGQKG